MSDTARSPIRSFAHPYIPSMPTYLTRRVTFAAAHRYRVADWSDEKNAATFGLCARPNYHGHSYVCDVTVTGDLDPLTGFVVDLGVLDRALQREVRERLDHANINLDLPEFGDGRLMPTGENLARFIAERVQGALGAAARVTRVTVAEDSTLSATYEPG
jgi:6-pyruvoyltetrahydropterin/6-carboxytetrahydropterin synthase